MSVIRRALISVSDKRGLVAFARALQEQGVEILSTGGTARLLAESGVRVVEVSAHTGFPEMLDGRVKTLHPRVHAGVLARRDVPAHMQALRDHDIPPIDLVVVNLYPFEQTIARPDCDLALAVENIDIGGPTLLRAAAKNHEAVAVVVDPDDYAAVLEDMKRNAGAVSEQLRFALATKVFAHTARYDGLIASYLSRWREGEGGRRTPSDFPGSFNLQLAKMQDLRYGENPHQQAAFYAEARVPPGTITAAAQTQGKTLSYNNIADADAALECVKLFSEPACVIVKHANPCGVAIAEDIRRAYERAYATDPTSAFGGIIAFNRALDADTARAIVERQFVEVIVAPQVEPAATEVLAGKPGVRVLACGPWSAAELPALDYKRVTGGLLVQQRDTGMVGASALRVVSRRRPRADELADLLFAWRVVKYVKSNAIVYARAGQTVGIGAGQMSRVVSSRIAAMKASEAGLETKGSVMASDAFFPFRDGIDQAAAVGIAAVIQPGGSVRDAEVTAAVDEHGMAMVFTGMRHFRH